MFCIFNELLQLSQKADRVIEKAFAEQNLDDKFLYAKETMNQIKNGCFPKYDSSTPAERKKSGRKNILKDSCGLNFENKSHILIKNSLSPVTRTTQSNDSGVIFVSPSDTEENLILKNESNCKEFSEYVEASKSLESKFGECDKLMNEKCNMVSSIFNNNKTNLSKKSFEIAVSSKKIQGSKFQNTMNDKTFIRNGFINVTPKETAECDEKVPNSKIRRPRDDEMNVHEGNMFKNITPKNKISLDLEEPLLKRRCTRSLTKYCSKMGISLDGSFDKPNNSLDRTYVISSSSNEENIDDVLNRTYVVNSASSEKNMGGIISKPSVVDTDVINSASYGENIENIKNRRYVISSTSSEENIDCLISKSSVKDTKVIDSASIFNEKKRKRITRNTEIDVKNTFSNVNKKMVRGKVLTSIQSKLYNKDGIKNYRGSNKESLSDTRYLKFINSLGGVQSEIKCDNGVVNFNNKKRIINGQRNKKIASHLEINRGNENPLPAEKSSNLEVSNYSKRYAQSIKKKSVSPPFSDKRKFSCFNSSSEDPVSEYKQTATFKKIITKKLYRSQFQTNSAPVYTRHLKKRICIPTAPVEFSLESNRQSLKDKAEEKRRQREIRVQKTKERRERLQREKEEKSRLNEERLKQRFEQHEKMLRQKVNKFKMTLRNQQQRNCRRYYSSTSTSSKDSKEGRAKDNDVCRNSQESSQQLSKVGNSYHDMSLKKVAPNSLQGDVGGSPELSEKRNSVASCVKTPVDFPTYIDVSVSAKTTIMSKCGNDVHIVDKEESNITELPYSDEIFVADSCPEINSTFSHLQDRAIGNPSQKQLKGSNNMFNGRNSEAKQLKLNENCTLLLERMSSMEELKNDREQSRVAFEIAVPLSENENCECSYSCFSSSKPKNNLINKSNSKALAETSISTQVVKKKRCLTDPKGIIKKAFSKKTAKKKANVTSYKLSDMHENSFDESKVDYAKIPLWASGLYLKQALIQQYYKPLSVEKIFGTIPDEPVDLTAIFQMDKPEYHRRTSSEKWSITNTPT